MSDDDIDIDATLRELVQNGDAEMMVDEATGERMYRLTDKGRRAAGLLLVKQIAPRDPSEAG